MNKRAGQRALVCVLALWLGGAGLALASERASRGVESRPGDYRPPTASPAPRDRSNAALQQMNQQLYHQMKADDQRRVQQQREGAEMDARLLNHQQQQQLLEENQRLRDQTEQWLQERNARATRPSEDKSAAKSEAKEPDTTRGCPYLVKTRFGLVHPPGARYCHASQIHSCERRGEQGRYAWVTTEVSSCAGTPPSPLVDETNSANVLSVKVYEDEE